MIYRKKKQYKETLKSYLKMQQQIFYFVKFYDLKSVFNTSLYTISLSLSLSHWHSQKNVVLMYLLMNHNGLISEGLSGRHHHTSHQKLHVASLFLVFINSTWFVILTWSSLESFKNLIIIMNYILYELKYCVKIYIQNCRFWMLQRI